jgi:Mn2+/Fe2+ NRAMP family transporter
LPAADSGGGISREGIATALAAFGIIGVGATELIQYPYWCLEKGYARWTGPRDDSAAWADRARGWLRVLRWDAWASMVVYTFATVAFFLLGAAVLGRAGLNASGTQMVRTLAQMYVPVFGDWAHAIFLFGAFAVLYSTFFVANASHARVCADAMRVFGLSAGGEKALRFWTMFFCGLFPVLCLVVYVFVRQPKTLVLASGLMQAIMLPMLGGAALFFRFKRCDARLRPTLAWDVCLWISAVGLLIAGGWAFWDKIATALGIG